MNRHKFAECIQRWAWCGLNIELYQGTGVEVGFAIGNMACEDRDGIDLGEMGRNAYF